MSHEPPAGAHVMLQVLASAEPEVRPDYWICQYAEFLEDGGGHRQYATVDEGEKAIKDYFAEHDLTTGNKVTNKKGQGVFPNGTSKLTGFEETIYKYKHYCCTTRSHCGFKNPCPFKFRLAARWSGNPTVTKGVKPDYWVVEQA